MDTVVTSVISVAPRNMSMSGSSVGRNIEIAYVGSSSAKTSRQPGQFKVTKVVRQVIWCNVAKA